MQIGVLVRILSKKFVKLFKIIYFLLPLTNGRLTATPEMVKTASDRSFTRVTVAVNRRYKTQNGEREADFITVVVWGRLAETLASYASKGSLISLDGELRTRKYDKDGQTHYVTEVLCSSFQLLESRAQRAVRENNPDNDLADLVLEEELPFQCIL